MRAQSSRTFNGLSEVLGNVPLLSSSDAKWQAIKLEENTVPPGQLPEMCFKHHAIGINAGQPLSCVTKADGHSKKYSLLSGDLMIMPAGFVFTAHPDRLSKTSITSTNNDHQQSDLNVWFYTSKPSQSTL